MEVLGGRLLDISFHFVEILKFNKFLKCVSFWIAFGKWCELNRITQIAQDGLFSNLEHTLVFDMIVPQVDVFSKVMGQRSRSQHKKSDILVVFILVCQVVPGYLWLWAAAHSSLFCQTHLFVHVLGRFSGFKMCLCFFKNDSARKGIIKFSLLPVWKTISWAF